MTAYFDARAGYAVRDRDEAMAFYRDLLELEVVEVALGKTDAVPKGLEIRQSGRMVAGLYIKPEHRAAEFTVLSLLVPDIDRTVDELLAKGVTFEYRNVEPKTDAKGIHRNPLVQPVAWFRDPSGNILSIIEAAA
jgi:catechol 2,3-dioxygenase-like lactoylglutathione lyase family enzyme